MAINLVKPGQVVNLDKGLQNVTVGLKWGGQVQKKGGLLAALFGKPSNPPAHSVDVDSSVIVVGSSGLKLSRVYYGHRDEPGIHHAGDDLTGNQKHGKVDNEEIYLTLNNIDPRAKELYFVANIFSGARDFSEIPGSYIRLINSGTGEELCRYELAEFKGMGSVILGKVYLRDSAWRFKAIGQGVSSRSLSEAEQVVLRMP